MSRFTIEGLNEYGQWLRSQVGVDSANRFETRDDAERELAQLAQIFECPAAELRVVELPEPLTTYAVDDEFGNQITAGIASYDAAIQVAQRYMSAHEDADMVRIYEDRPDGELWDLRRAEVLQ